MRGLFGSGCRSGRSSAFWTNGGVVYSLDCDLYWAQWIHEPHEYDYLLLCVRLGVETLALLVAFENKMATDVASTIVPWCSAPASR